MVVSQTQPPPHFALFPDAVPLVWAYGYTPGSIDRWYRSWEIPNAFAARPGKAASSKIRFYHAQSVYQVVCADFDELPDGYASWLEFYWYSQARFRGRAGIGVSASGKVKLFFLLKDSKSDAAAMAALDRELGELAGLRDPSVVATLRFSAATPSIANAIKYAVTLPPLAVPKSQTVATPSETRGGKVTRIYQRTYRGQLPEGLRGLNLCGTRNSLEAIVRILVACPALNSEHGYQLPATMLSRSVGVSAKTARKWLLVLEDLRLLQCLERGLARTRVAGRYVATNALAAAIAEFSPSSHAVPPLPLPPEVEIADGEWDDSLFKLCRYFIFRPLNDWLAFVARIPGSQEGRRMKEAEHKWNRWQKYANAASPLKLAA